MSPVPENAELRKHLLYLLRGGGAHVSFDSAIADWPEALRGERAPGLPHTGWQLLEHIRIAQYDILEFSRDPHYISPEWPEGYWPTSNAPQTEEAWSKSIDSFRSDLKAVMDMVEDPRADLFARIPHGTGQTLLREALLVADHNAYHLGQIIYLRRALGDWKPE